MWSVKLVHKPYIIFICMSEMSMSSFSIVECMYTFFFFVISPVRINIYNFSMCKSVSLENNSMCMYVYPPKALTMCSTTFNIARINREVVHALLQYQWFLGSPLAQRKTSQMWQHIRQLSGWQHNSHHTIRWPVSTDIPIILSQAECTQTRLKHEVRMKYIQWGEAYPVALHVTHCSWGCGVRFVNKPAPGGT